MKSIRQIKVFEFFLSYMPQITFNDHLLEKKMSLYFSLNKHNNILMTTVSFLVERKSRQIVALVVATSLLLRLS